MCDQKKEDNHPYSGSELLSRSRENHPPMEYCSKKLKPVFELYLQWYDGDKSAAKVALVEDLFRLPLEKGDHDGLVQADVVHAISAMAG